MDNRSIPRCTVIPELGYADVVAAAEWLCAAFGFTPRIRIGSHRIQLNVRDGAIVVIEGGGGSSSVMVRVDDVDAHHAHAVARGVEIARAPKSHPFGERQYTAVDLGGHRWKFTQSISDVAPESWGGESVNLR